MALRDRLKLQGMFPKIPDMGEIEGKIDQRVDRIIAKLDEILVELRKGGAPQ